MLRREFWLRHWLHAAIAVVALLITVTAVKAALKIEKPGRTGEITRTALLRWQAQIRFLHSGGDPYLHYSHPNPPILALILTPFATMPPLAATLAWFMLKVGMAALIVLWTRRLIGPEHVPPPVLMIGLLLALPAILGDLSHGNVNLFIAFLVFAGLELYRRGMDVSAGVLVALAVCCKLTPLLFLPYFVWKRAWRTVAGFAAGVVLFWWLVPGLALGFDRHADLFASWFDTMVKPFIIEGRVTSVHPNQSLPGLLTRLFTDQESFIDYDMEGAKVVATESHTLADLGPKTVNFIVKGIMLLCGLVLVRIADTWRDAPRQGLRFASEAALVLLGMLLFSERTWKHHAVTVVLPLTLLAAFWWRSRTAGVPPASEQATAETSTVKVFRDGNLRCGRDARGPILALILIAAIDLVTRLLPTREQDLAMVYGVHTLQWMVAVAGIVVAVSALLPVTPAPRRWPAWLRLRMPTRSAPAA